MSLEAETHPVASDDDVHADKGSASNDWEARLAVARAKRKKVLSQQAAERKAERVKKPPFILDNVDLKAETAAFLFDNRNDEKPAVAPAKETEDAPAPKPVVANLKVVDAATDSPVEPLPQPTATVTTAPATSKSKLNRVGLVLVGCFTGLGFGFALGLGVLVGSGWVSPQQFAIKTPEPAVQPIPVAAPVIDVQPIVFDLQSGTLASMTAVPATPVVLKTDQPQPEPLVGAKAPETAWMQDLGVAPYAGLSTTAFDLDAKHIAQFQASDANNPASVLGAYSPTPLPQPVLATAIAGPTLSGPTVEVDIAPPSMITSGYTDLTWAGSITDTPPTQLTTRSNTDPALNLVRFQVSDTNNPATVLSAYAPSPLSVTDFEASSFTRPSHTEVRLASVNTPAHELPQIQLDDIAFFAPTVETPQLSYQLAYTPTVFSDIDIPAPSWPQVKAQIASFVPSAAKLKVLNTPEPDPTFAQAMGLSAEDAQKYGLILLAPDKVKDADLNDFSARLGETGLPLQNTKKVGFTISKPHIRFYSDNTRLIATSLAEDLGIEARDFTSGNRQSTGIEVWMAGSTSVKRAKPRKVSPRPSTRTRLSNSIISGLRNATTE
jgi:hypothetical protein